MNNGEALILYYVVWSGEVSLMIWDLKEVRGWAIWKYGGRGFHAEDKSYSSWGEAHVMFLTTSKEASVIELQWVVEG